jgi:polyphosphate kinase
MTDTDVAPWWKIDSNDKKRARINAITHLLASIPYEHVKFHKPKLGRRQDKPKHVAAELPFRNIVPDVLAEMTDKPAVAVSAEAQKENTTNDQ